MTTSSRWTSPGRWTTRTSEDCVSATMKMFPLSMMSPTMARGLTIAPTEPHPTRHPLTVVIVRKCSYVWVTRGGLWIKYPPRQWLGATKLRNLLRLPFSLFNPLFGLAGQRGSWYAQCSKKFCWVACLLVTHRAHCVLERKARSFVQIVSPAQWVYLNKWSTLLSPC